MATIDDVVDRRRLLAAAGAGLGSALAGCLGGDDASGPTYHSGTVDANGSSRTPAELTAAEAVAVTQPDSGVTPLDSLSVDSHEFVLEDGYKGATVQGTVVNDGASTISTVEVRARVYDADGAQLGQYLARTGDLAAGDRWSFTVVVLQSPADLADYDVAVLGSPV